MALGLASSRSEIWSSSSKRDGRVENLTIKGNLLQLFFEASILARRDKGGIRLRLKERD